MSVVGYKARNHPQQTARRGSNPDVDDRATPPEVFAPLHERYGFTVDAAAAAHNTKCDRFWTEAEDGLEQSWAAERVWVNPPYSFPNLPAFVAKAWREWMSPDPPGVVVMLLPANRTEQQWWQDMVEPYRDIPGSDLHCEFLPGRTRFLTPGQSVVGPDERPPFDCCLLVWERREASRSPRLVPAAVSVVQVRRSDLQTPLFELGESA